MLYALFWVIPRRLNFICRRFGTPCSITRTYLPMKMEQTGCSETSVYKIQTPGNHPKKAYNLQDMAKVWNQEPSTCFNDRKAAVMLHFKNFS